MKVLILVSLFRSYLPFLHQDFSAVCIDRHIIKFVHSAKKAEQPYRLFRVIDQIKGLNFPPCFLPGHLRVVLGVLNSQRISFILWNGAFIRQTTPLLIQQTFKAIPHK